ncbi:hypothetical protein ACOME3_005801 [Neoechinorhynchus agilis]
MRCIRQADCILAVALSWMPSDVSELEKQVERYTVMAQKGLVLLHILEEKRLPKYTANWLSKREWCSSHHHIRCPRAMFEKTEAYKTQNTEDAAGTPLKIEPRMSTNPNVDLERLARFLTGRSVGLVLGGGGAKGCAHIGLIKSMLDSNIPIDMIGGTSIGSFVAALYATDLDIELCAQRAKSWSRQMASYWMKMIDLTYPLVSMFTGKKFNQCLEEVFGDCQIEDLWIPYFCVTTDLSFSKMRTHTTGEVWRFVRSSMSYATLFPPFCDPFDGHLLMDGCYVNNVPADVMRDMGAYLTIAVDVGSQDETEFTNYGESLSGWWMLWQRLLFWRPSSVKIPNMAEIQSRLAYVSCQRHLEIVKNLNRCVYVRPPIDPFGSLDFNSFDDIRNVGYKYGQQTFRNQTIQTLIQSTITPRIETLPPDLSDSGTATLAQTILSGTNVSPTLTGGIGKKPSMIKFVDLAEVVCGADDSSMSNSSDDMDTSVVSVLQMSIIE